MARGFFAMSLAVFVAAACSSTSSTGPVRIAKKSWRPDTNLYVGSADTIRAKLLDSHGNPITETVVYTVTGPATVAGSIITATGLGVIRVKASVRGVVLDTLTIGAVPPGMVVGEPQILHNYYLSTFTLDGRATGDIAVFAPNSGELFGGTVHWSPTGASVVFDECAGVCNWPSQIATVSSGGVSVLVNALQTDTVGSPIYSRDGAYIYYANSTAPNGLWRMRPDGSGDSAVTMQVPEHVWSPSPSPDGTRIAYIAAGFDTIGTLKVLSVSTGAATSLGIQTKQARWSPNSETIAYTTSLGGLALVQSSGAGNTPLATGPFDGGGFDWSPDGQWLIISDALDSNMTIVNATTGIIIPEFRSDFTRSPAWGPPASPLQRVRAPRT